MNDSVSNKSFMISGYYGFGNAGDEAILIAIIQQIRENFPGCRIIVLSNNPEATAAEYGVDSFDRKDFTGIMKLMKEIDVFISGGGGLVQDSTGFSTVAYYLSLVQLARFFNKKVMLYAQGLGPLRKKRSRALARIVMNQASLISYRDEYSLRLSERIGVKKPAIHVTADPVFALKPPPRQELEPVALKEGITGEEFTLGISVRPWNTDNDYISLIAALADSYVRENHARVIIFPFQQSQDEEICLELQKKMEFPSRIVDRNYSIPMMMGLLGKMDIVIGMRLHSLIFSAVQGVPSLGISYDPKVSSLMSMVNLPWLDVETLSRRDLFDASSKLYLNRVGKRNELLQLSEGIKKKADQNVQLLKSLLP